MNIKIMRRASIFFKVIIFSLFCCSCQNTTKAFVRNNELKVFSLFSDHMVLQQKASAKFWGRYLSNEKITITASWGEKAAVISDSTGNWAVNVTTPKAGGPYSIKIETKNDLKVINDVLIGEVWVASGQSNMDISLGGWLPKDSINNSKKEIAAANYPSIRFFKIPYSVSAVPVDSVNGKWIKSTSQTASDFSATAYFYAKKLYEELNVPIGIIQSSLGGTPAEAWTSSEGLRKMKDFDQTLDAIAGTQNSVDEWLKKWNQQKIPANAEEWQKNIESDTEAAQPEFDDSKWEKLVLPGRIDLIKSVEFNGGIWLRKQILIDDVTNDYTLKIAEIDDMDLTYFNGVKIGGLLGAGHANAKREMLIPKALLKKGTNTIAICVIDTGGPGSVSGSMIISNGKNSSISIAGEWKSKLISEIFNNKFYKYNLNADLQERPNLFEINSNTPSALYNTMINPLLSYTIKGVIWYQGESNVGRAEQYKTLFPIMIEDWREKWGYRFPFYFTQIAPYSYTDPSQKQQSQKIRNAQRLALKVPNTGMAVTLDIGRLDSAHPTEKKEVGERLARFALSNDYGKVLVSSGPLFKQSKNFNDKLIIEFEVSSIGSGLMASEKGLINFEIAGIDKVYVPADAKIIEDKVVVSSPLITRPVYVRYAWSDQSAASLFNKEGLPAATFISED